MKPSISILALALATAGCHVASSEPMAELTRARGVIFDSLPVDHPVKGHLLLYASNLDHALRHPGDEAMARATLVATNCLGFLPEGHLASDTKRAVDAVLISSPERTAAYRRYVMQSSSMAITREEVECREQ